MKSAKTATTTTTILREDVRTARIAATGAPVYTLRKAALIGEMWKKYIRREAACLCCGEGVVGEGEAFVDSTTSNGGKNIHNHCVKSVAEGFTGYFAGCEKHERGEAKNVEEFTIIVPLKTADEPTTFYLGKNGFCLAWLRGKASTYYGGLEGKVATFSDGTAEVASRIIKELFNKNAQCEVFVRCRGKFTKVNDYQHFRDTIKMNVQQRLVEE